MGSLNETTAKPPYFLGNFPRVEIVFECFQVPDLATSAAPSGEDLRYMKLVNLKKLVDSGVITQAEFEREKTKLLSHP